MKDGTYEARVVELRSLEQSPSPREVHRREDELQLREEGREVDEGHPQSRVPSLGPGSSERDLVADRCVTGAERDELAFDCRWVIG
jgi:hypothetical protein